MPASQPKFHHRYGTKFPTAPDSWSLRLRMALRFGNGAVLTARQVRELAEVIGMPVGSS